MTDGPAYRTYATLDPAAPEGDGLNLAWTRDERDCLAVDLMAMLAAELRDEPRFLERYLVRDPFGEQTLGPAVAAAFELPAWQDRITCGAGVVSLLHALARLAPHDAVRIVGDVYPDFPHWNRGNASGAGPVWFLERPSLLGDAFASLADVSALCDEATRSGAVVLIDESNANYYPPSWSAAALAAARDDLVVIRGFSKAYGLGALRLGFCVAGPAPTERIRAVIPPLLASSLSLRLGACVLAAGDLAAPLRSRLAARKPEMLELLGSRFGSSSEHLPYVLSRDHPTDLEARGITGKLHPVWSNCTVDHVYRVSVPLTDARFARLRQLLSC